MIPLPGDFSTRIVGAFGDRGSLWLAQLPALIEECVARWSLRLGTRLEALSYSYVAFARLPQGGEVVLKLAVPNRELRSEVAALQMFNGRGAVRLLDADPEKGILLLERVIPGALLADLGDDERATAIAIDVMRQLWRPEPRRHGFPTIADWSQGFGRLRARFRGGSGPFPEDLVKRAEKLYAELGERMTEPLVLHGDLHHWNVLSADHGSWLAIDPKGVVGERAYEPGAWLRNQLPDRVSNHRSVQVTRRRIDQFAVGLSLQRQRLLAWSFAQAMLSAWWSYEDHDEDWDEGIRIAEIMLEAE